MGLEYMKIFILGLAFMGMRLVVLSHEEILCGPEIKKFGSTY